MTDKTLKPTLELLTPAEYLKREELATVRHEYVAGQLFVMSGVTLRHNIIAMNICTALRSHVRGSGCRTYMAEVKVHVEATNSFYYPDALVSCGDRDQTDVVANNPVLIVEILSRSTAAIDRREKMIAYRRIPSLKEYLILHQAKPRAELHRRTANESWDVFDFGYGTELLLEAMPNGPLTLPMSVIYDDITWKKDWTVCEETAADFWTADSEEYEEEDDEEQDNEDW